MIELHRKGRASLAHRAQVIHVPKHIHKRHHRVDDVGVATHVLALDLAAPRIQVADDGAGVVFRGHHLDLHDRLEQNGLALLQRFAECRARCDFEGQRRRVDVVILAVDQLHLDIHHREAGDDARTHDAVEALFDAGDVFLRHRAANDLGFELVPLAGLVRLDDDRHFGELTGTAGLLLVRVLDFSALGNALAERHLRRADIGVDLVGAAQNVDLDVEMEFAHALEDGLAGLLVGRDAERRIFRGELRQRDAELFLVGLRLRLDRDFDHRLREFHLFQDHRLVGIAQRVAGARFLQASECYDVAGKRFLDVFAVVGMHQQHAADALLAVARRIDDAGAGQQRAGIDAAEGDGADERVVHDLERQQSQRLLVVRQAHDFVAVFIEALDGGHVDRRRQIIHDRVEQGLHALVLERRAAQHREERAGQHGLADHALQGRLIGLLAIEVGGKNFVVEFDGGFQQLLAIFLGLLDHVRGDVDVYELGVELLFFPDHALHADEIDQALEIILGADRKLDRNRLGAEAIDNILHAFVEVGAGLIHFVGEDDARNLGLVALAPDGFGLRLNALVRIEHAYRAVEHAQRTLDFDGEVDVAGGIDDVETLAFPESGGRSRRDRYAALLLLLHPVHRRGTFVHFADFVALAGVIEDAFGGRGLAGIDMRHDTEVTVVLYGMNAGHGVFLKIRCFAVTSDSARRRGWLQPSDARLHAS